MEKELPNIIKYIEKDILLEGKAKIHTKYYQKNA